MGSFDSERSGGTLWIADEFNHYAAMHAASSGRRAPRLLSEKDLACVRELRDRLFAQWFALAPGETLELQYEQTALNPR